jgi:hypothetical protein
MVKGRDVLEGEVDREEERCEARRGFVVKKNVRQRVRERAEERYNRLESRDIGGGGAGLHGVQVNVPVMQDNEEVLVSCRRFDREAPGQIGGSPLRPAEGERVAVEGGQGDRRRQGQTQG